MSDPTPTTSAERGIDPDELERELESGAAILHGDESTCVAPSAERVAALEAETTRLRKWMARSLHWANVALEAPDATERGKRLIDVRICLEAGLATLDEHA